MHSFVNDLERPIGIYLYGRRMYEVMTYWETADRSRSSRPTSWTMPGSGRQPTRSCTRRPWSRSPLPGRESRRASTPAGIRQLKDIADRDISVGGAELAAQAFEAGLVDELHLLVSPVVVGGGKRALPVDDVRLDLTLQSTRRFANGVVHLQYLVAGLPTR